MMKREPLLGAHMSIAGGIYNAFERGAQAGCRTVQVFLKNSNQWEGKALIEADRERYLTAKEKTGIDPVVAHNSYLINLASPDPRLHQKSLESFVEEMCRANFLGIPYVIVHPGAHMGAGEAAGIDRIATALAQALARVPPPVRILLETTAGQGSSIGHRFEHLAGIFAAVHEQERLGVCLDTCHIYAAGYDISTKQGYEKVMREFNRVIGTDRIRAIHLNDSKRPLGSRVDRHAHIGQGTIGLEGFRSLLNDRRFSSVPKILETPKGEDLKEDIENLAVLRSLIKQ